MDDAPETAGSLLADLCSRDTQRVWSAAWGVVRTEDEGVLDALWPQLPRIERRTADLDLGGGLASNNEVLEIALKTLRWRQGGGCRCTLWPQFSRYDPNKLAERGAVQILSTSEPDYEMTYECRCGRCGQTFHVEQREYHLPWWKWVPG
ncbi:hypothetical protein SAMN04488058_12115 [Deinococcus reticulitermitis]|uniref:Uncharacterized protein n=1 Tax=Deinococcus reticulitermitis TaxID=856736 RepID=A0A1H7CB11_9DEIO|nr:hypothetical protein [Deinococcus reticulitermitis]SEJ82845.1 hypothetical protein SAMN04488058_12115 [Deinococcus reticulitermitis]